MKISAVITAYNLEKEIRRCVDSVLNQSYDDYEIIVVNDGSTDGTEAILREIAEGNPKIKIISKENGGQSTARNAGFKQCTGDYIFSIDGDDEIDKDSFRLFADYIEGFGGVYPDIVLTDLIIDSFGKQRNITKNSLKPNIIYSVYEYLSKALPANEVRQEPCSYVYSRKFLEDNKLEFIEGVFHEDMEFLYRILSYDPRIAYWQYPYYLYIYRAGSTMMAGSNMPKRKKDIITILRSLVKRFREVKSKKEYGLLMGLVVRQYIHECAEHYMKRGESRIGLSCFDLLKYACGKDKIKAAVFIISRNRYYKMYDKKNGRWKK